MHTKTHTSPSSEIHLYNTKVFHLLLYTIYILVCTHLIALIKLYTCAYWLQAIETALCIRCARCIDYYSRLYVILTNVTCLLIAFMLSLIWIFVWSTVIFIDPYKSNKNNRHIILFISNRSRTVRYFIWAHVLTNFWSLMIYTNLLQKKKTKAK